METRREPATDGNVRYICYKLLQDVRSNGEAVVPRIIKEIEDPGEPCFLVEELRGDNLRDVLQLDIPLIRKFQVVMAVLDQLRAIDEAGFVIFDRHGENIRVVDYQETISVRQMDVEKLY